MARADGVLVVAVEDFARAPTDCNTPGLIYKLRVGARTFTSCAPASGSNERTCFPVFEFETSGEDGATLELSDGDVAAESSVGTAAFSFSRARTMGSDRLEVPVLASPNGAQLGVLSLSLKWTPAELPHFIAITSASTSGFAAASAFASVASGAGASQREEPLSASASATVTAADELVGAHQGRQLQLDSQRDELAGPSDTAGTPAGSSSPPAAASAKVMAAMVAVAAMVAAASELPATSPSANASSSSAAATAAATAGSPGPKGALRTGPPHVLAGAGSGTFYPPIQPYDAAPPREFGPGNMPSSSAAGAFYPDIALRLQFPAEVSVRLDQLRTLTVATHGA